jgi:hypothetical protein
MWLVLTGVIVNIVFPVLFYWLEHEDEVLRTYETSQEHMKLKKLADTYNRHRNVFSTLYRLFIFTLIFNAVFVWFWYMWAEKRCKVQMDDLITENVNFINMWKEKIIRE